jgi:acetyl-CoA carboxylase biotin carboxylase subunit
MKSIHKILIANRGEIAVRIIRTAREMGISTVAIFSHADAQALHTESAHEKASLGTGSLTDTYLNIEKIIHLSKQTGADAIHPGYGFLSENPDFALACEQNNIQFIGPNAHAIKTMGNKLEAAKFVSSLNIPLLNIKTGSVKELINQVTEDDFPLMIKAAAGGGGKGMKIVHEPGNLEEMLESTAREALNYFGNADVYLEKYIQNPKHIEVQILGDNHGNYIHLNERECSVQRRHQKIVEEAPSPFLDQVTRKKMGEAAIKIAKAIEYSGAGTVEFLVDQEKRFHFLEMNTRIQVEHPVTELITGIDIVREQIRIACDMPLSTKQNDVKINGHAIEARLYAEDPANNFLPSPGKLNLFKTPQNNSLRLDSGVRSGDIISADFDPMLAKAIVWKESREEARTTLIHHLDDMVITGIHHNANYLTEILNSQEFIDNTFTTNFIDLHNNSFVQHLLDKKKGKDIRFVIAAYIYYQSFSKANLKSRNLWNQIGYWRPYMQWDLDIAGETYHTTFTRQNNTINLLIKNQEFKATVEKEDDLVISVEIDEQKTILYIAEKEKHTEVTLDGFAFKIFHNDYQYIIKQKERKDSHVKNGEQVTSPMYGKVVDIKVEKEMKVSRGQTLMVLEAMKMENNIIAEHDSTVKYIAVKEGDQVEDGQILIETYEN